MLQHGSTEDLTHDYSVLHRETTFIRTRMSRQKNEFISRGVYRSCPNFPILQANRVTGRFEPSPVFVAVAESVDELLTGFDSTIRLISLSWCIVSSGGHVVSRAKTFSVKLPLAPFDRAFFHNTKFVKEF